MRNMTYSEAASAGVLVHGNVAILSIISDPMLDQADLHVALTPELLSSLQETIGVALAALDRRPMDRRTQSFRPASADKLPELAL